MNGEDYPAKTLYEIVICLQFHLETLGYTYKLLVDDCFKDIKYTLDNLMKIHTEQGIGCSKKSAEVFSFLDEDILWETGVVGVDTPDQLRNAVFIALGLTCAMRAGKEHHAVRCPGSNCQLT